MKILIGGDLVLTESYEVSNISDNLRDLFRESDLNIINLEAPVTESDLALKKTGPHLKANIDSTAKALKYLEIDLVTLANNHILDYDEQGVEDTLSFCSTNSLQTVGAGMNLEEASTVKYLDSEVGTLAIVNFAENEWSIATKQRAGANPMDLIDNASQIKKAKHHADFVIVIVHGGNEHNLYPSPRMVKQYRFYADCGANIVVGHHTHCISGFETYGKVPVFYSLGNFLFTIRRNNPESWYTGLVLSLNLKENKEIDFEIIPVRQSQENDALIRLSGKESIDILNTISEINKAILDPTILEAKWMDFIKKNTPSYVKTISPLGGIKNKYIKAFLYRSNLYKFFMHDQFIKEFINRIRCEAHYDIAREVFKSYLKE